MTEKVIYYDSQIFKIQTLVDGGFRLTLDLVMPVTPETIVALFDAKRPGAILKTAAVVIESDE